MMLLGLLIVGFIVGSVIASFFEDSGLSEEDKAERRRDMLKELHARRMLEIQAEHEKKQKSSDMWHTVGGTAAKIGVGLLISGITGGKHRHRH
ncbi:MAG: hypothetical protein R3E01_04190 [Pirellulaceae bacterium]